MSCRKAIQTIGNQVNCQAQDHLYSPRCCNSVYSTRSNCTSKSLEFTILQSQKFMDPNCSTYDTPLTPSVSWPWWLQGCIDWTTVSECLPSLQEKRSGSKALHSQILALYEQVSPWSRVICSSQIINNLNTSEKGVVETSRWCLNSH